MTPVDVAAKVLMGRHAMVSFCSPHCVKYVANVCESFVVDNGAFSAWQQGKPVEDWWPYYNWINEDVARLPGFTWAVIPDVIDGSLEDNKRLIHEWPLGYAIACPVWHMHEPLEWLEELVTHTSFVRLAIGSSGGYASIGTYRWWERMYAALDVICDGDGLPRCQLHGLRMTRADVVGRIPFSSVDSTTVARNLGLDSAWNGSYQPPNKAARGEVLAARMESGERCIAWNRSARQLDLFGEEVHS